MSTHTPASLSRPLPHSLARARSHAYAATETSDPAIRDREMDLAHMWAAVSTAESADRCRYELRSVYDQLKRLTRRLTIEGEDDL